MNDFSRFIIDLDQESGSEQWITVEITQAVKYSARQTIVLFYCTRTSGTLVGFLEYQLEDGIL
jgi:hypothetical protein